MAIELKNYDPAMSNGALVFGTPSTGTVSAGSVTINALAGIITTASLTTGTATAATFDLVNNKISSTSHILATIVGGTNTGGLPTLGQSVVAASGSATISLINADSRPAGTALNGTLKVAFVVLS
jgi:hypothetical protein